MREKERGPKVPQDKRDIVDLAELDAAIARGIADADAGRVHPAAEVFDELPEWIRRKVATPNR
jgi:predicted transcriptional regulator